ncbi:hypothetical protein AURDEDRAFT_188539 [Auricularia subglabra TFB-10046 SS5]|uniref:SH3 domain-containing protein n=1 Tax=Auricularia subglabra (strain TFB-10046 / SS5) TaxID=717982 RepID=J0LFA8_AURST|nr:hypothetical protein AURDEDRAFT_188539 [Auricularia subglabra TFB-10046 SS5]
MQREGVERPRPARQDTFELRNKLTIVTDEQQFSDGSLNSDDDRQDDDGMDDDDLSSELSIPDDSINFDLVYAIRTFAATVEGQANVFKGDSLVLMDDSNSYWWLVQVLKTSEIGYIPAEIIETPYERLARLNKHKNQGFALPTDDDHRADPREREKQEKLNQRRDDSAQNTTRSVIFTDTQIVHNYPPAVWNEEEMDEDDEEGDGDYDEEGDGDYDEDGAFDDADEGGEHMEPDDGMDWHDDAVADEIVRRSEQYQHQQQLHQQQHHQQQQQQHSLQAPRQGPQASSPVMDISRNQPSPLRGSNEVDVRQRLTVASNEPERNSPSRESFHQSRTPTPQSALLPSAVLQQEANSKRTRAEVEAEDARKRSRGQQPTPPPQGQIQRRSSDRRVLRKERSDSGDEDGKKKKGGMFSSLFGRRNKDKDDKRRSGSVDSDSLMRSSQDTFQSHDSQLSVTSRQSPPTSQPSSPGTPGMQRPRSPASARTPPPRGQIPQQMLRVDQETQARNQQQYLRHSPANSLSPASPNFQSPVSPASGRQRPGSLILSPGMVPELNVMRVFAGDDIRGEATFKTVLVNSTTSAADLVRQALQRFHIRDGDPAEYFLSVKRLSEGGSAALRPDERPLAVFEQLVEAAQMARMPKVKRSSMGSISSLASNLSTHPAIAGLAQGMNDFADDSAVRFYLNRRRPDDEDLTLTAEEFDARRASASPRTRVRELKVDVPSPGTVPPERFTSPTVRFALQVLMYPDDLPTGLVFDPQADAVVPRPRNHSGQTQRERRKVLLLPENTTVAEVIELGLDRFGIADGVVDGGDEVEDKLAKRSSQQSRVRYNLTLRVDGEEDELVPTSRVLDAFPVAPKFVDGRQSERLEDSVRADDPMFVLRRATRYRQTSRSRLSNSLDEVELQQLHRRSASASSTGSATSPSNIQVVVEDHTLPRASGTPSMTRQELIAAQREASRANQRAIISAQSNSERGVDVVLPNRALLRSSRLGPSGGAAVRYSYIEPDGETYDIGEILESEWRGETGAHGRDDLLKGAVAQSREGLINRVINKIKDGKLVPSSASTTDGMFPNQTPPDSENSLAESSQPSQNSLYSSGSEPTRKASRSSTPTSDGRSTVRHKHQPSVASAESAHSSSYESSGPSTPATTVVTTNTTNTPASVPANNRRPPLVLRESDFGVSRMVARIELLAATGKRSKPRIRDPREDLDAAIFGTRVDLNELHPDLRDVYKDTFRQLDDLDLKLDQLLQSAIRS